ncbi:MAG: hypothetical protein NC200_05445 [Candidatus Gastranaerophilales bacterium]|nr:hypothetical protein [Candidatus Gastranaerophilales bacterium]
MSLGVERIGSYEVVNRGNGQYSVHTTAPGHLGAFVTDEKGLEEFRKKCNRTSDEFVSDKPKMTEEEANMKAMLFATLPIGWLMPGSKEALEARKYYAEQDGSVTNKQSKVAKYILSALATVGLGFLGGKVLSKFLIK